MVSRLVGGLGILACPGGEQFADEVLKHLSVIHKKKLDHKADILSRRYGIPKKEVIERINFFEDIYSPELAMGGQGFSGGVESFKIPVRFTRFANGEFKAELKESVRGKDVYIFQDGENHEPLLFNNCDEPFELSVNDHVMSLFIAVDTASQAGAERITVVIPAYPFSRQHEKKGREALTASWFGRTLEQMGVARIITLDIHSKEIENTFNHLRLENLHGSYQTLKRLSGIIDLKDPDLVVVSPDTGAVDRNKYYAGNLQKPLAMLYKERDYTKVTQNARDSNITNIRLLGSVEGKNVFMADDLLGTGGTLIKAMEYLKSLGAKKIITAISLPLFSGEAIDYFDKAYERGVFFRVIGTNAVFHGDYLLSKEWFVSVNVAPLFARIIHRLHHNRSLSALLDNSRCIQDLLKG